MLALLTIVVCLTVALALAAWRASVRVWALVLATITLAAQCGLFAGSIHAPRFDALGLLAWPPALILAAFCVPALRRAVLVAPIFRAMRRALPRASVTLRQTLESGGVGFEAEFFGGRPSWQKLRAIPAVTLTSDELAFLDGPTEELCRRIDDWDIRHNRREIPESIWSALKAGRFLGLCIAKEHGGLGFSAQALSLVLGKICSRSLDVFGVVMVANTLGLGELIGRYGTNAQKRHYLPRLARGEEIPCLALTGPASGSDAAAMRDVGRVTRGGCTGAPIRSASAPRGTSATSRLRPMRR
jgi:acyl-CoA dehydrogenase